MIEPLIKYCTDVGEHSEILDTEEKSKIQRLVKEKYIRDEIKLIGFSVFECLDYTDMVVIDIPDSWKWINDFIQNRPVIVFFNPFSHSNFIRLNNGNIFADYYEEAWEDEFYITDKGVSFLLGYNHSQVLFAMGEAKSWLQNDIRYKERINN